MKILVLQLKVADGGAVWCPGGRRPLVVWITYLSCAVTFHLARKLSPQHASLAASARPPQQRRGVNRTWRRGGVTVDENIEASTSSVGRNCVMIYMTWSSFVGHKRVMEGSSRSSACLKKFCNGDLYIYTCTIYVYHGQSFINVFPHFVF